MTVRAIIESAEGSLTPASCMDNTTNLCEHFSACATYPIYEGLYRVITEYLDGVTLQDILDRKPNSRHDPLLKMPNPNIICKFEISTSRMPVP